MYKSKLPETKRLDGTETRDHHFRTPACLLECAKWVLDIEECPIQDASEFETQTTMMDPKTTKNILTVREPMINYKSCTLGQALD